MTRVARILVAHSTHENDYEFVLMMKTHLESLRLLESVRVNILYPDDLPIGSSRGMKLESDFVILLLSAAFVQEKMPRDEFEDVIERWRREETVLCPFHLDHFDLGDSVIARIQASPRHRGKIRPLKAWPRNRRDQAIAEFVGELRGIIVKWCAKEIQNSLVENISVDEIKDPTGVALNGDSIYIADHAKGYVIHLENHKFKSIRGGYNQPHHLAVAGEQILLADTYNDCLVRLNSRLNETGIIREACGVKLSRPHGATTVGLDKFYALDTDNGRVLRIAGNDVDVPETTLVGGEPERRPLSAPFAIASNNFYVCITYAHHVIVYDHDLRLLDRFGEFGRGRDQFINPVSVAMWRNWLVITDEGNQRLQLWQLCSGPGELKAKQRSLEGHLGSLGSPYGLAFSPQGILYVTNRRPASLVRVRFPALLGELGLSSDE